MMKPITPQELNETIMMLGSNKAEGLDCITNDMIKNTGVEADSPKSVPLAAVSLDSR